MMKNAYYYTRDHLGSVREMCSSTGTITSRMAYDPYGRTTTVSGTILPTRQYAGYYAHQMSGLYLTRGGAGASTGRAYDSNTGRWLSRDSLPDAETTAGSNLYDYVGDNPVDFNDPFGLDRIDCIAKCKKVEQLAEQMTESEFQNEVKEIAEQIKELHHSLATPKMKGGTFMALMLDEDFDSYQADKELQEIKKQAEECVKHCKDQFPTTCPDLPGHPM